MNKCFYVGVAVVSFGCLGCSATSLRCSTDGDSSYVELINVPQELGGQSRHFKELCSFAYEEPVARLSIIDSAD